MFTKNAFTQTDAIADLIKGINEADYKAKMEALKGNQHKIDKNKNNKVDADDFKILRGEKKVNEEQVEEDTSVKIPTATGTRVLGHRYGNAAKTHRDSMADPFAVVKGPKQKDIEDLEKKKVKKEEIDPNKVTTDTLAGRVKGKTSNPFAPKKVMMDVPDNVKEEVEELDELSKKTLSSYAKKAMRDAAVKHKFAGDFDNISDRSRKPDIKQAADAKALKYKEKYVRRRDGVDAAIDRLTKEEVDELEFTAEDIENFMQTEEYEQLDELSKNTLKRYSDAANKDFSKNFQHDQNFTGVHSALRTAMAKTNSGAGGFDPLKGRNKNPLRKHDAVQAGLKTAADAVTAARAPFKHKMKVRNQGMHRAVARLNKEEVEQMDERTLSKGETAEKERIVKGMKKSLAGFKERYGKDAKSVMYATATKAAKKD
jgi:hypothetical protein